MKDAVFVMGIVGMVLSWMLWGIYTGSELVKVRARHFLIAALCATAFTVGWAIKYGV